jgi:hypothetical protein
MLARPTVFGSGAYPNQEAAARSLLLGAIGLRSQ